MTEFFVKLLLSLSAFGLANNYASIYVVSEQEVPNLFEPALRKPFSLKEPSLWKKIFFKKIHDRIIYSINHYSINQKIKGGREQKRRFS